jgi:hypothetical protein
MRKVQSVELHYISVFRAVTTFGAARTLAHLPCHQPYYHINMSCLTLYSHAKLHCTLREGSQTAQISRIR